MRGVFVFGYKQQLIQAQLQCLSAGVMKGYEHNLQETGLKSLVFFCVSVVACVLTSVQPDYTHILMLV